MMDNDHGITGELREWAGGALMRLSAHEELTAIADRIDAEHESALYDLRREHDEWEADRDAKWVKLPVDADGKYIRIGDEMETLISPFAGEHCAVEYLILLADGWEVDGDAPTSMRHYHKPTVEDVLTEFGIDWEHESDCEDRAALLKEYAAKLRLVGDAE